MIRLYRAVCDLIEAHTDATRNPPEEQRDVDMPGTLVEDVDRDGRRELDRDRNRDENEVWGDDHRRVGFTAPIGPRPQEPRP